MAIVAPWPLTGRSAQLEELGRHYRDPARAGVVLHGPAGVGKTRLAEEALRLAERGGRTVERAVGHPATQEIIAYRKIIKPERSTLRGLERYTQRFLPEELELYYDDIVDAAERIWDLLDNYKEVVEALEDTNESIISHRQQYRLQLLTVVSVILLPLTLIASIFGMNNHVPGENSTAGFWIVIGLMVVLGVALLGVFRWRRWL